MLACGVEHRNVRRPNVLWNPEIRNVVLIDFEMLKPVSALQETSPNRKREHLHLESECQSPFDRFPYIPASDPYAKYLDTQSLIS